MHVDHCKTQLVEKLRQLLEQSGQPGSPINLEAWLEEWIREPSAALGGETPAQAMRTASGRRQVETLLERIREGLPG